MQVQDLSPEAYAKTVIAPFSVFDTVAFAKLNEAKVDRVHYLVFSDEKNRFGLIAGEKDGVLKAPYSAPYACFSKIGSNIKTASYGAAVQALVTFARKQGCSKVRVTLPPSIYDESHMARLYNGFYVSGFQIAGCDLNFQYALNGFGEDYEMQIDPKARQKLRASMKNGLTFEKTEDVAEAYAVIKANREHKNYPLWMTLDNVMETRAVVDIDFFIVRDETRKAIASAMVYSANAETALVVYWGNLPDTEAVKPMNFLAYHVFAYYAKKGKQVLDIGPSTEFSVPNIGLCDFKQSIGCGMSTKLTLEKGL